MAIDASREIALKIIYEVNENGAYSNIALNKALEATALENKDRAFITELVYGTVKWKLTLDWVIAQYSSVKLKKISSWVMNVLRLGVYQLLFVQKVPVSAACNESVNLAKRYGHAASSKFVNGVLRNIARNRDILNYPDENTDQSQFLAVKYAHPTWLVDKWLTRFGRDFTESLLQANNVIPDVTVRVNTLKIDQKQLKELFENSGIEVNEGSCVEEALVLKNPGSIARIEGFEQGYFQVQDQSSMLVAKVLDPKPGEAVLDVCSAPGGKTTHIAQIMGNQGTIEARDVHENKLRLITEAAKRLGIAIITTKKCDAMVLDENSVEKYDRVLVDAPCSGLGIIRKKPDIKWTMDLQKEKEIIALQKKILQTSSKYVKSGGTIVYSTCTTEIEENEEVVAQFISQNPDFELSDISSFVPKELVKPSTKNGTIQLFPNEGETDGFFIAKMKKKGNEHGSKNESA